MANEKKWGSRPALGQISGGEMWARHLSGSFSRGFIWDNIKTGGKLYLVGIYERRWPSAKGVTAGKYV